MRIALIIFAVVGGIGAGLVGVKTYREAQIEQFDASFLSALGKTAVRAVDSELPPSASLVTPLDKKEAFETWRADLIDELKARFEAPPLTAPELLIRASEAVGGGLTRELLEFRSRDGSLIPAVMHYKTGAKNEPAILLIPGHTKPHESGLAQLVDDADSYQHAAALTLAKAGYVTLAFELRGFGLLGQAHRSEHRLVAYNALLNGGFYKRLVIDDAFHASAALRDRPEVDPARVGIGGVSLGGELVTLLALLDNSFKAIYFAGYGGQLGPFELKRGQRKHQPHYCHIIPGATTFMQREAVVFALAPRPLYGNRGALEGEARAPTRAYLTALEQLWSMYGAGDKVSYSVVANAGHEFIVEEAIRFFQQNL